MQADHRGQRALEIVAIILRARLRGRRHLPFGQRGHAGLLLLVPLFIICVRMQASGRCRRHDSVESAMIPLSILDLSPVVGRLDRRAGACAIRSIWRGSPTRLGYMRYWVAEHHNLPAIASSAPEIMIGQIAAVTERIARRLRRRDAAQPRAADGGRALQGAGGALSRPHRSRPRPRARHRSGHVLHAAPPPGHQRGGRLPRALQRTDAAGDARLSRRPSVPQCARHAGRRDAAADLSARLVGLFARSSPARSARPLPSRIISRPSTRSRR